MGTSTQLAGELVAARRSMGCEFSVTFPAGTRGAIDAGCAALDEVDRLEDKLSVYRDDSVISDLNRNSGGDGIDAEVFHLLAWAARLSRATGGAFDPASGALVKAWEFWQGPKRVPSEAERVTALACSGCARVRFEPERRGIRMDGAGVQFNLGGIGKGYAIDRALELVHARHGITRAFMQGGQSSLKGIGAVPSEPRGWMVDIGNPSGADRPLARVWLRDRALGTSAATNQFFLENGRRYGHVLDPRTGWPTRGLLSASAVAPTATEADALSTAFFVLGIEGTRCFCERNPRFGAVLVAPGDAVLVIGAADAEVLV